MGYNLKKHSGASKRFKKTGTSIKSRGANRNHILSKQSTKRKRIKLKWDINLKHTQELPNALKKLVLL